jgi:hypothetical protein
MTLFVKKATGDEVKSETLGEQVHGLIYALAAGSAAMPTGSSIAGHGILTAVATAAITSAAGHIGSINSPLARAATLFMLFTIIAAKLGTGDAHPLGIMFPCFLGAAWTAGVSWGLRPLFRALRLARTSNNRSNAAQRSKYSVGKLLRRSRKSLAHLSG